MTGITTLAHPFSVGWILIHGDGHRIFQKAKGESGMRDFDIDDDPAPPDGVIRWRILCARRWLLGWFAANGKIAFVILSHDMGEKGESCARIGQLADKRERSP